MMLDKFPMFSPLEKAVWEKIVYPEFNKSPAMRVLVRDMPMSEIKAKFPDIVREAAQIDYQQVDAAQGDAAKPEKPKQKGRYRLTKEEIKFRRRKVKEAEKMKKGNPQKLWKEIDKEFADGIGSISDRTFRDWRHTHYS